MYREGKEKRWMGKKNGEGYRKRRLMDERMNAIVHFNIRVQKYNLDKISSYLSRTAPSSNDRSYVQNSSNLERRNSSFSFSVFS